MSTQVEKLLLVASVSLSDQSPVLNEMVRDLAGSLANELFDLLKRRNGFYAFESSLHVFPAQSSGQEIGIDQWNADSLWRAEYDESANGCLFFAEDVFGGQFCIRLGNIYSFDPETGKLEYLADNIEAWARQILEDYQVLTGYPLAHQWQEQHGRLSAQKRLLPKIPFVAGGAYALNNLYLGDAIEGMRFRASIAKQIRDLPDGTQIKLKIVD